MRRFPLSPLGRFGGRMLAVCVTALLPAGLATAASVGLINGTATYSQTCCSDISRGPFDPAQSVDGIFSDSALAQNGWGIFDPGAAVGSSHAAVWETLTNVGPSVLTFRLYFLHHNPGHLLGRFRLSVTSDDRATFADGLSTGGAVAANWSVLTGPSIVAPAGLTFETLPDSSLLVSGAFVGNGVYQLTFQNAQAEVTGIRLDAIQDSSLPNSGPGRFRNGNFVLTEIQLDATVIPVPVPVPVPASGVLFASALVVVGFITRSRRKSS